MKIDIIPFADAILRSEISGKTVVVIDVLRATSVMITALKNGAKQIIPAESIEEAKNIAERFQPNNFLLCGERDAVKINSFDLGNSPLEYTTNIVKNKSIILTTTNGTKALKACQDANTILIGAFLNVDALVQKAASQEELILVCAGTNGKFSLDDALCAGYIIYGLSKITTIQTDELGRLIMQYFENGSPDLIETLKDCFHLNFLTDHGFADDVKFCLQLNSIQLVPEFLSATGNIK